MKTVFNGDMVFHVWNQQSQPSGRRSDGRVSFDCRGIYSYGSHYCLGWIMPDGVALLNSTSYSVSTSKHQSSTRSASRNRTQYYVPDLTSITGPYEALNLIERGERDNDSDFLSRGRANLLRYISGHALKLSADTGYYLMMIASGAKTKRQRIQARKRFDRLVISSERAKADKLAKEARDKFAAELRDARNINRATPEVVADWKARIQTGWNAISDAEKMAKTAYHAHRAAKRQKWEKVARKCYLFRREVLAFHAWLVECKERKDYNRNLRSIISRVREGLKLHAAKGGSMPDGSGCRTGWPYQGLASAAEILANHRKRFPAAVRAKLADLAAEARELHRLDYEAYEAKRRADNREKYAADFARFQGMTDEQRQSSPWLCPHSSNYDPGTPERATMEAWQAGQAERQRQREEAAARQREAEARERAEREAKQREAWLAGDSSAHWRGTDIDGTAFMRIIGDTLQTSLGAEVPLSHAVRVFRFVKAIREQFHADHTDRPDAIAWRKNGHSVRVGHFQVDCVYASGGFQAGCHRFAWPEIERVAKLAGVADYSADSSVVETSGH